jgi:hypothetical protein
MTTPETQRESLDAPQDDAGRHNRPADLDAPMQPEAVSAEPMPGDAQPGMSGTSYGSTDFDDVRQPDESGAATAAAQPSGQVDQTLFGDRELSDFHSRWTEVQSAFVDDPRDCVQKADGLVADVVDKLTAGFAQARSGLEEQWSRGEQVSTEDLRIALQRYRDFFERLLAV